MKKRGYGNRKMRMFRRRLGRALNPTPTFTETYQGGLLNVPAAGLGGVFQARITDIPQIAQYATLYRQYRINWIKVMVLPLWNYSSADPNSGLYNNSIGVGYLGAARIAYAVNNTPDVAAPASEAVLLEDNGAKVVPLVNKWSKSCKPVPGVEVLTTGNGVVPTKQRYRQWFNFDTVTIGNNPVHQGISYYITGVAGPGQNLGFNVFYKVNFSLRDPQ